MDLFLILCWSVAIISVHLFLKKILTIQETNDLLTHSQTQSLIQQQTLQQPFFDPYHTQNELQQYLAVQNYQLEGSKMMYPSYNLNETGAGMDQIMAPW